jgi:hypothetical protein
MLTFMMHTRTAWSDYFTGTPTSIQTKDYISRQTPSGTSVYISNCLFKSISSSSDGGALCCTSVTHLLIESTSFFSCKTSSDEGGAIYFYNTGGQCVLNEVCGYDCCSTYTSSHSYGQFAYTTVNDAASSKNYVSYSSIVYCQNTITYSSSTFRFYYGKIWFSSVNSSMNKCYYYSVIACWPFKDLNFVTCSFSYSSFADNNAAGYTCKL